MMNPQARGVISMLRTRSHHGTITIFGKRRLNPLAIAPYMRCPNPAQIGLIGFDLLKGSVRLLRPISAIISKNACANILKKACSKAQNIAKIISKIIPIVPISLTLALSANLTLLMVTGLYSCRYAQHCYFSKTV